MDADFSHPPSVLPKLWAAIEAGNSMAVASRYVPGGGVENWPKHRLLISRISAYTSRFLTPVVDSGSGCFMFRKGIIKNVDFDPKGFKIGLEIQVKAEHGDQIVEVPFIFADRRAGESKLGFAVTGQYFEQLLQLSLFKVKKRCKSSRGSVKNR